jgi:hypothetical protein
VRIRIEGVGLPGRSCGPSPDQPDGYHNIHVGVQRRDRPAEILGLTAADAHTVSWTIGAEVHAAPKGTDVRGPFIQGRPGGRFIYLSWGTLDGDGAFHMFRRAKLLLNEIPRAVIAAAIDAGLLVGRLGLTDANGNPLCAAVRPPVITWSAEADDDDA